MPGDAKTTPRDVLRALFRRWRVFVPAALVLMVLVLVAAHWVPLKYTGETIFERRLEAVGNPATGSESESFEAYGLRLRYDLAGYHAVEEAVEKLGLEQGLPRDSEGVLTTAGQMAKQQMVRKLMKDIDVRWDVRSAGVDRVSVTFTHTDPVLAQRMPDMLVKNYMDRISQQIILRLSLQRGFLDKKVQDVAAELVQLEAKRIQSETKHAGMMPGNPGILQERIQQVSTDIDTLRRQDAMAKKKLAGLEAYMASFTPATTRPATNPTSQPATQPSQVVTGPNPELRRLENELTRIEGALDDALTVQRMTEKHPTVIQLRRKVEQLEEKIKNTPKEVELHRVYETDPRRRDDRALRRQMIAQRRDDLLLQLASARTEVEVTANELERLQQRLTSLQGLMANFGPIRQEYLKILKDIADKQTELRKWKGQLSGVQMALAGEVAKRRSHFETIQAARKQFRPTFPSLWMVLAGAVVGGLGLAGGLVFLTSALDRSISTSEEAAKHFDLPVHGVIGEIVTPRQRVRRKIKKWLFRPVVAIAIVMGLGLSTLSIVLWLRYPENFKTWKADPVGFVTRPVTQRVQRLWKE